MSISLWFDLRSTVRSLMHQRVIVLLAVAALGLGIGLPTAMFGLVDASVMRGLPVDEARRIYHLERRPVGRTGEGWGAAPRDYLGWQEQQRSFEALGAFYTQSVTLRGPGGTDRWEAAFMTPTSFEVLGARAERGRVLSAEDARPGAAPAVVLGHVIWRDRFQSDPQAVGQTVWIEGEPHTVVGVMPANFRFPSGQDVWLPLAVGPAALQQTGFPDLDVIGRLRRGVSADDAAAEFAVIAQRMAERYPETNRDMEVTVKPIAARLIGETATATMFVMLGAVLLVLLIACTNVANLLLVRAVYRVRELAIRSALGASRTRILRQLFLESAVLAVAGGLLGLLIARLAMAGFETLFSGDRMPYWAELRLDLRTIGFALAATTAAALFAGVLPALKSTSRDLSGTLYDASRGSTGLRVGRIMRGLIVLEIALSLGLLVTTGLMVRSVRQVQNVSFGFATAEVFTARITLPDRYDEVARQRYYDELLRSIGSETGVSTVALGTTLPAARAPLSSVALSGRAYESADDMPRVRQAAVTSGFFETFGVAPLRGRLITAQDDAAAPPVVVVNARFVERYLEGQDPIGRLLRFGGPDDNQPWRTIIGVVPDLWLAALDASGDRNPAGAYVPLAQIGAQSVSIAARVRAGAPLALTDAVRRAAFQLDPDVPIYEVRSMPDLIVDNSWFYGLGAWILGACGGAALLLAIIGLYGVIAFGVERRTREFGIRMAVGARPAEIVLLVLRQGSLQIAVGIAIGLGLAFLLARGVASLLFNVSPSDPVVFVGIGLLLGMAGLLATLIPAVRASRIDPLRALHAE